MFSLQDGALQPIVHMVADGAGGANVSCKVSTFLLCFHVGLCHHDNILVRFGWKLDD
jgi:hypothetical protein